MCNLKILFTSPNSIFNHSIFYFFLETARGKSKIKVWIRRFKVLKEIDNKALDLWKQLLFYLWGHVLKAKDDKIMAEDTEKFIEGKLVIQFLCEPIMLEIGLNLPDLWFI